MPVLLLAWSLTAWSADAPASPSAATASGAPEVTVEQVYEAMSKGMAAFAENSFDEAFPLLTTAAKRGLPQAQARVGYMYLAGKGVKRDGRHAIGWLGVAANSSDDAEIRKTFDDAWKKIPPELVPQYQKLVDMFVARYGVASQGVKCSLEKQLGTAVRTQRCLLTAADGEVVRDVVREMERESGFGLSGDASREGGAASGAVGPQR